MQMAIMSRGIATVVIRYFLFISQAVQVHHQKVRQSVSDVRPLTRFRHSILAQNHLAGSPNHQHPS